jgi:hypothetical protein
VQKLGWENFNGHISLEARIIGVEDGGHTPAADLASDFVTADLCLVHR